MDQRSVSKLQHVNLRVACAVIYTEITGKAPDSRDVQGMRAILNDVAHAIANVITIYSTQASSGVPIAISPYELIEGKFRKGGHVFTAKDGSEMDDLTVLRGDMRTAISVLRAAKITFRKPVVG